MQRNRNCKTVWKRNKDNNSTQDLLPDDPSF